MPLQILFVTEICLITRHVVIIKRLEICCLEIPKKITNRIINKMYSLLYVCEYCLEESDIDNMFESSSVPIPYV
jgi:hypothetical protein